MPILMLTLAEEVDPSSWITYSALVLSYHWPSVDTMDGSVTTVTMAKMPVSAAADKVNINADLH